jgi:hypothetical protein
MELTSRQGRASQVDDLDVAAYADRATVMTPAGPARRHSDGGGLENTQETQGRQQEQALDAGPSAAPSHNASNVHEPATDRLEGVYQDQSLLSRHDPINTQTNQS